MNQLVKIIPLEPYAFGTDQKFCYPGEKSTGKESYFVRSRTIPEQTTILGMLRFLVLKQRGLLHSDFQYTEDEKQDIARCIGPESFQFGKEKQDFGCIHGISPVFLMDREGHYLVKNPFHNTEKKKGYQPMMMSDKKVETSFGEIRLPKKGEYDAKTGHATGYYHLSNGSIHQDLFTSVLVPGNRKNNKISDDDSFFKKEFFVLKKGYCFAVFVDADDLFQTDTVSMGMGGNTFLVTSEKDRQDDLDKCVKKAFAGAEHTGTEKEAWFYALSDLVVQHQIQDVKTFCIVEQKQMRNLTTDYSAQSWLRKLALRGYQRNIIQSGSVFFESCSLHLGNENDKQIGYNRIVEIGGNCRGSDHV
ncbi:MAG: hypothetical protein K2N87_19575 [Eubacterium sp.]|nr:hypothetical protein [Eubacterium sp.]